MRDKINENELIRIGIIIKPHGLKGELKVQPLTSNIKRFELLESVNLAGGDYAIERIKYQNKYVILKFRGIDNIETAEKFRNVYLEIPLCQSYNLQEGEYFYYQLEGLKVYTTDNEYLGEISEILELPANDVYVVQRENHRELLIPAIDDVVKKIDINSGVMIIELLEGLI